MPNIVGSHQSAFIKGRCLHDNYMLVHAMARRLHSSRNPAVMLKLDITKAFDTVDWAFLLEVMRHVGFGQKWIAWVAGLLASSSTRVLVNGIPGEVIYNKCGLRQGDPFSPLLFVIIMGVLHALLQHAASAGVLTPLAPSGMHNRTSIFADDVVIFIKPDLISLRACNLLLHDFGVASGLRTNRAKSSAHPIRCSEEQTQLIVAELGCQVRGWPCQYLGLPLGLRKATAGQLQYLVDRMGDRLPAWKARLLHRSGRLELLRTTLSAMPIHAMMALDIPIKTLEAANKVCRGFLWKGRKDVHGGHCLVAWNVVCSPKEYGGLGVPNLRLLNISLRARWPWLARTDQTRPWSEFNIQVDPESLGLYRAATRSTVGDGESTLFWTDWWMEEGRVQDWLPNLYLMVKKRAIKHRTVSQAVAGEWWHDVSPNMTALALQEFLMLVDRVGRTEVSVGIEDKIAWRWEGDGCFSARSAYRAFFAARTLDPAATQIWKSRAPPTTKVFAWLAAKNRCWTADRLQRRQMPHPAACPLCDQEPETINHLILGCVFARQVWARIIGNWGQMVWMPTQEAKLVDWWTEINPPKEARKEVWTVITLVAWTIWTHRNDIVFNGVTPSVDVVLQRIDEEGQNWRKARLLRMPASMPIRVARVDSSE
jgi:hypothetical protein